jgi:hypothetical protein
MFSGLPPPERETISLAALIGRTIDLALLSEIRQQPLAVVADHLNLAIQQGLLTNEARPAFVHDLVQEAAEGLVAAHRRVALHAVIAEALWRRDEPVGALPHLIAGLGALEPVSALSRFEDGWDVLVRRLAFEQAVDIARQLWEAVIADARCGPALEARVLLRQSWGHQVLGDVEASKAVALHAARRAIDGDAPDVLADAAITRAAYGHAGVPDRDTAELLDGALQRLPGDRLALRSRLLAMRGFYLVTHESRGEEARATTTEALQMARRSGDDIAVAQVLQSRLFVLLADSDVHSQLATIDELHALQPRLQPPVSTTPRN